MKKILVLSTRSKYKSLEKPLALVLGRALLALKALDRPVEVVLVTDPEMRRLNRLFRGKDKPTTVLSFDFDSRLPYPKNLARPLGEIYLAPDYIRRVGSDPGVLLVHGLVHLLGYTHNRVRDKMVMERLERKILSKISRH